MTLSYDQSLYQNLVSKNTFSFQHHQVNNFYKDVINKAMLYIKS
jgi:hypothetical protein